MRGVNNNGKISTFPVGGIGQVGYGLYQHVGDGTQTPTAEDFQTITFTFSEPLKNLRFSITDIDRTWATNGSRDFIDGVYLESTTPFTSNAPANSYVIGNGKTEPWQNANNVGYSENGPGGQIDVVFTESVTSFTIRYVNLGFGMAPSNRVDNDQAVFVTGFRTNRPAAC